MPTCRFNQNYSASCFSKNINIYTPWECVPYAGTNTLPIADPPSIAEDPLAFLQRTSSNTFVNPLGTIVNTNLPNPYETYNLASEFRFSSDVQCNLTNQQIRSAKYWGTVGPIPTFNAILNSLLIAYNVPINAAAMISFVLNGALNDILIITDYEKFKWNIIRPCQYNRCFRTVICTPLGPTYPSGHSTVAGCMSQVLAYFFPNEKNNLFALAQRCSDSRYEAGVHFRMDCEEGLLLGRTVANSILQYVKDIFIDKKPYIYTKVKKTAPPVDYNALYQQFAINQPCDFLLLDTSRIPY